MKARLKKFTEAIEANKFQEVIDEIKDLIEKTVKAKNRKSRDSDQNVEQFVSSYEKNPEDVKIEGLINDSDVYDFYLKFRNQVDECLKDIKFYDKTATEIGAFGLYEYVIKGTNLAVKEFVLSIGKK